jgi:NAD(P)-dependent dehydrogenase (short-subunit alcohol dehydrogenase family)
MQGERRLVAMQDHLFAMVLLTLTSLTISSQNHLPTRSAVLFLCSDAASMIVGHNLVVDGGFTV